MLKKKHLRKVNFFNSKLKYFVILIIFLSVGFAIISTSLSLSGDITLASWNVYLDNVQVKTGSVTATTAPTINDDKDTVSFAVKLSNPGDYYSFTIDAINAGTMDAMVNEVVKTVLTTEQATYIDYEVTYYDGVEINQYDYLKSSTTETLLITLEYKSDASSGYSQTLDITINSDYIPSDDNAKEVDHGINLYKMMKRTADKKTTINFKANSGTSGTNGIYTTTKTDSGKPVYYYRGSYTAINNNLIFNNMCWKIIRTTETGGVKIIYNGTPVDGKCETQTGETTQVGTSTFNSSYNDNAYVGYMYGTVPSTTKAMAQTNTNNSTIKQYIDNWYTTNFTSSDVTSKLEDTVFCNDRTTKAYDSTTIGNSSYSPYKALGYGTNATFYGAAHRSSYFASNPNPSLVCTNNNDKFTVSTSNGNGALTNPVGLITLDEVVFAGFNTYYSNTSNYQDTTNYLYTSNYYWTLSPVSVSDGGPAIVGIIDSTSRISSGIVYNSTIGVRPVVSLADGTFVESDGNGSTTNPYVVK